MDQKGSLVDNHLKIYPCKPLIDYIKSLPLEDDTPINLLKFIKGENYKPKCVKQSQDAKPVQFHLNSKDTNNLNKIKEYVDQKVTIKQDKPVGISETNDKKTIEEGDASKNEDDSYKNEDDNSKNEDEGSKNDDKTVEIPKKEQGIYIATSDLDWLYAHLKTRIAKGDKDVPFLHDLLEGANIEMPENKVIQRNPVLEARCVKLRAQQEAREYRKMTKTVDNVRMRFPEDSISYQMKQLNRQLIAVGQFLISIFAGFLFGFRGVEWMVGNLDFGFRLLLGVMCALIIALAEIYFLAKKLNEELNIPETVQLGGPNKFNIDPSSPHNPTEGKEKEHND